jgi:hypothetical protein
MLSGRYRKKPVVVDAIRWDGGVEEATTIIDWVLDGDGTARYHEAVNTVPEEIAIDTLEGTMNAQVGDWIIRGVKGEFYPCKPDVFELTYELDIDYFEEDMEFKHFVRKPFLVEAIEITTENIHELADLIGEFKEDHTGPYIEADPEKVPTVTKVTPGYWLTKMGKNVRCYSSRIFTEQFTESTPSIERVLNKFQVEAPRRIAVNN